MNLGPTINIDRDPRWGRSFEAYTEDPFLNAAMAVGEIDGVQSTGEMSPGQALRRVQPGDQQEHRAGQRDREQQDAPRDLLPGFEQSVTQAHAGSVMCSYAMINGAFACNNAYILRTTLDQRWHFPAS